MSCKTVSQSENRTCEWQMKTLPAMGQTVVKASPVSRFTSFTSFHAQQSFTTRHRTRSCGQLQTQQSLSTLLSQRKRDTIMQLSASLGTDDEGKPRGTRHWNTAQASHDRLSTELKSTPFFSINIPVRGCSSLDGQQLICISLPLRLFLKGSMVGVSTSDYWTDCCVWMKLVDR